MNPGAPARQETQTHQWIVSVGATPHPASGEELMKSSKTAELAGKGGLVRGGSPGTTIKP